jgi:hypothetical protein
MNRSMISLVPSVDRLSTITHRVTRPPARSIEAIDSSVRTIRSPRL